MKKLCGVAAACMVLWATMFWANAAMAQYNPINPNDVGEPTEPKKDADAGKAKDRYEYRTVNGRVYRVLVKGEKPTNNNDPTKLGVGLGEHNISGAMQAKRTAEQMYNEESGIKDQQIKQQLENNLIKAPTVQVPSTMGMGSEFDAKIPSSKDIMNATPNVYYDVYDPFRKTENETMDSYRSVIRAEPGQEMYDPNTGQSYTMPGKGF